MNSKNYENIEIYSKKNKNSDSRSKLKLALVGLLFPSAFVAGQIFHHKKTKDSPIPFETLEKQPAILVKAQQTRDQHIIFYTKKIDNLEKKLDKLSVDEKNLNDFLSLFSQLKANYKLLSSYTQDEKIQNYIFQKQKILKNFETKILQKEKNLDIRAQKLVFSIQNGVDLSKFLSSDVSFGKKNQVLKDEKNIFEKRVAELENILSQKKENEKILMRLGQKSFKNFDNQQQNLFWQNRYLVWENNLENQKKISDMIEKNKIQNPQVTPISTQKTYQNNIQSSSITATKPNSQPNQNNISQSIPQNNQTISSQNSPKKTLKTTPAPTQPDQTTQNLPRVLNQNSTNISSPKNFTPKNPILSQSRTPNNEKIYVIAQQGDGIFQILRRYNIQPTNKIAQEFEKINGKDLQPGKKYIILSSWKKNYLLKPVSTNIVSQTQNIQNPNPENIDQKKIIFRALNFLSQNNIKLPDYITGDYLLALAKKQGEKNIYKNFSLSDKIRINKISSTKNLDFSSLDNTTLQYAQLAILLLSYEKDWKKINPSLGGVDLQNLTTWSYVGNGWEKMKCVQSQGIKSVVSRKHFLSRIFGQDFEQKKVFDKNFGVYYSDIVLKNPSQQVFCQIGNQKLTYGDLKNITRYVELVQAIK